VVRDANGFKLAYVYGRDDEALRLDYLTSDEAPTRRIVRGGKTSGSLIGRATLGGRRKSSIVSRIRSSMLPLHRRLKRCCAVSHMIGCRARNIKAGEIFSISVQEGEGYRRSGIGQEASLCSNRKSLLSPFSTIQQPRDHRRDPPALADLMPEPVKVSGSQATAVLRSHFCRTKH
jgi:hypothetical protein